MIFIQINFSFSNKISEKILVFSFNLTFSISEILIKSYFFPFQFDFFNLGYFGKILVFSISEILGKSYFFPFQFDFFILGEFGEILVFLLSIWLFHPRDFDEILIFFLSFFWDKIPRFNTKNVLIYSIFIYHSYVTTFMSCNV
jgi:hypothetical protein